MDLLGLLDEVRTIARNGLTYATSPYDLQRYERLFEVASQGYATILELPPAHVRQRLQAELGYITPKVGTDGALFDSAGRILLLKRSDDQTWCLPGGWVEPNESPATAAIREIREETGLEARIVQLVDVMFRPASLENGPHSLISVSYLCEAIGGSLALSHESEAMDYWLIEDVPAWHPQHDEYAKNAYRAWQARQGSLLLPPA